jgi:hypothetical protein
MPAASGATTKIVDPESAEIIQHIRTMPVAAPRRLSIHAEAMYEPGR